MHLRKPRRLRNEGMALALCIMLMGLFMAMVLSLGQMGLGSLHSSVNQRDSFGAQMAAESGIGYMAYLLKDCTIPSGSESPSTLMDSLATQLGTRLDGTTAIGGQSVVLSGEQVTVPAIASAQTEGSFVCTILPDSTDPDVDVVLRVQGSFGDSSRTVEMGFKLRLAGASIFDYALATNGRICINGSSILRGVNDASEANIMTTVMFDDLVFTMNGSGIIEGDLYAVNEDAYAWLRGSCSIGGEDANSDFVLDHIHTGIDAPEFPTVDPTPFLNAVTLTDVTAATDTSTATTFNNIRIKAGTNKSFTGGTTLNGVVYVEAPNDVTFSGDVTINGVIVTEDGGTTSSLVFNGGVEMNSVESLPDTPEFSTLRTLTGSSILAPGFHVTFNGSSTVLGGMIAVDNITINGSSFATLKGGIITYSTDDMWLHGGHVFQFDRSDYNSDNIPSGFSGPSALIPVEGSYTDYASIAQ